MISHLKITFSIHINNLLKNIKLQNSTSSKTVPKSNSDTVVHFFSSQAFTLFTAAFFIYHFFRCVYKKLFIYFRVFVFFLSICIFTQYLNYPRAFEFLRSIWIFTEYLNFYRVFEFLRSIWIFTEFFFSIEKKSNK